MSGMKQEHKCLGFWTVAALLSGRMEGIRVHGILKPAIGVDTVLDKLQGFVGSRDLTRVVRESGHAICD